MPALPAATAFTGSTVTEAQFKTATADQREFLAALLGTAGTQAAALTAIGAALNGVLSKSANYLAVAADRGKLIDFTSPNFALTLPTVAAAGAGYVLVARNSASSGSLTINRNSANIDGTAANLTLTLGESCFLICDGTGWKSLGRGVVPAGLRLLAEFSASSGSTWTTTVPALAKTARITIAGGGGGGSSGYMAGENYSSPYQGGFGGGGGSSVEAFAVTPGGTLSGNIGAAGAGGALQSNGSAGGQTTCTQSGQSANGGAGGLLLANGVGGTATGGDTNTTGATGGGGASGYGNVAGSAGQFGSVSITYST